MRKSNSKFFSFLFIIFCSSQSSLGRNSARLRRKLPSLRPPHRKTRIDALDIDFIETISKFIHYHCQTSPDKKHLMKRAVAKCCYEYAPKMFRFESWDELWQAFVDMTLSLLLRSLLLCPLVYALMLFARTFLGTW